MTTEQKLRIARKALRLIAPLRVCESFTTGIGECFKQERTVDAEYTADRVCDSCIAHDALDRIAGKRGLNGDS